MKKIILFALTAFTTVAANGQTTLQSEDFTTYLGTAATAPLGWTFSYHGNYTTTASSGISGPNSYKFGVNNATVTTPMFTDADTVSFWLKGNGTDANSKLIVLESADNISYDTIVSLGPLPTNTTGMTYKFPVSSASQYLQFVYVKSLGNAAFDDYRLIQNPPVVSSVTAGFSANNVCFGDSTHFMDQSTGTGGPITSRVWNFGDASSSTSINPVHLYAAPGGYEVTLTVIDSSLNTDTYTDSVWVHNIPVAGFASSGNCSGIFMFTDTSSVTNSSITEWMWTFGDPMSGVNDTSSMENPSHTYPAGTYTVTEIVSSAFGCSDTASMILMSTIINTSLNASVIDDSVYFTGNATNGAGTYTYSIDYGDGSPMGTTANSSHIYTLPGVYTACLTATDSLGCADSSCETFNIIITGISTVSYTEIQIVPNPSTDGVFIFDAGTTQPVLIEVYNVIGKSIKTLKTTAGRNTLDLSAEANGAYFITVTTNKEVITKKVIISK
ncbi:MAG TPA: PKD domain-containing protein [Bacteroidia bacterium]|jgi:PKD repeat protein